METYFGTITRVARWQVAVDVPHECDDVDVLCDDGERVACYRFQVFASAYDLHRTQLTDRPSGVAFVQNGRLVTWPEVTTEDLRAELTNYPDTLHAVHARAEWKRRMGKEFVR